jgi:undecaprenyl-diphosphatase
VSSSGHTALVPALLGWRYAELPGETRKVFEVALHAGSAPALALALRGQSLDGLGLLTLTLVPPALAGLALERPIERRLGGMRSVALAQLLAGAALLAADRRPERRTAPDAVDHLLVGLAQALALAPGVSRSGAALTAARLRGLSRESAGSLALRAALPVTVGAAALKGVRALAGGVPAEIRGPAAAGAAAALASTLAALPLARRRGWTMLAGYRMALGLVALRNQAQERRNLGRP